MFRYLLVLTCLSGCVAAEPVPYAAPAYPAYAYRYAYPSPYPLYPYGGSTVFIERFRARPHDRDRREHRDHREHDRDHHH